MRSYTRILVRARFIEASAQDGTPWRPSDEEGLQAFFVDWRALEAGHVFRYWLGKRLPFIEDTLTRAPLVSETEAWIEFQDHRGRVAMLHLRKVDEEIADEHVAGLFTRGEE